MVRRCDIGLGGSARLRAVSGDRDVEVLDDGDVRQARAAVRRAMVGCSDDAVHAAELVVTELVTNALLHGEGVRDVRVRPIAGGVRLEVADAVRRAPFLAPSSTEAMTGRGLALVARLAHRWGSEPDEGGKVTWAEVVDGGQVGTVLTEGELLSLWSDAVDDEPALVHVTLGEVPTDLLVAAKRHVDNLVREFTLAAAGDLLGTTAPVPRSLADLIERVVNRFQEARLAIKRQATEAARAGAPRTVLELDLPLDVADAAEEYLDALDEADAYCRANRLLTLETPPQHRAFRRWYVGEIVAQVRAARRGEPAPEPIRFESLLLAELDAAEGREA